MKQLTTTIGAQMENLETQIGQLAKAVRSQYQKGHFSSNTEANPKAQYNVIFSYNAKENLLEAENEDQVVIVLSKETELIVSTDDVKDRINIEYT